MENKFWMVMGNVKSMPVIRHDNKADAATEAIRLAGIERGKFFVLECVGKAETSGVCYTDYGDPSNDMS